MLAAVFAAGSLFGCSSATGEAGAAKSAGPAAAGLPPAIVRVEKVRRQNVAPRIVAVGTVRASHSSIVASGSDGVVELFSVEEGDYVEVDAVLSQLRSTSTDLEIKQQIAIQNEREAEYAAAQSPRAEDVDEASAKLRVAEVVVANAQRRLNELLQLQQSRAVGDSAVKDGQDSLNEATQNLGAAKAAFARTAAGVREEEKLQAKSRLEAQQFFVRFLEAENDKRTTLAPFSGFVAQRHSYAGQWLSKGSPVITLLDLEYVDVQVQIDQEFVSQVLPDKPVSIRIAGAQNSASESGEWPGVVKSIVSQSEWESGSRSFPVVVRIENEMRGSGKNRQPVLREGMMAEAEFFGEEIDAILVPKDSMVRTSRGTYVFAINPATPDAPLSVRQVMVTPGISEDHWIAIQGTDLEEGALVVTEGAERLRAFATVQIMEEEE